MEIHLPANNCPIGEYKFFAQTTHKDRTMPIVDEKCFPVDVIILFNPWNSNDFVHLTSDTERQEYVMNQNGLIWMGRDVHNKIAKNWRYGQFEDDALSVLLSELQATSGATVVNTLDRQTRAIPSRVARHLAARVNSNDGGILQGNWSPDFSGGTSPFDWRGSPQILSQYKRTGNAVKYGQCWVFAGTLTTLLRCSGIPSRPVTNYMSGHDTNGDGILDIAFDHNGNFYPAKSKDSIWNYHVWSEAWMQRARGIGHSGWQVVDATPQEKSDGTFQCGPAAVSAIKQNLGGIFDVTFVRAEINALTRIDHYLSPSIYSCIQYTERHDYVGKDVSTKSIGNNSREDITSNYK